MLRRVRSSTTRETSFSSRKTARCAASVLAGERQRTWQAAPDAAARDDISTKRTETRALAASGRMRFLRDDGETGRDGDPAPPACADDAKVVTRDRVNTEHGELVGSRPALLPVGVEQTRRTGTAFPGRQRRGADCQESAVDHRCSAGADYDQARSSRKDDRDQERDPTTHSRNLTPRPLRDARPRPAKIELG